MNYRHKQTWPTGNSSTQWAVMKVDFSTPGALQKASSGPTMATKPGVVTTATGGATGSGVAAGGSVSVGTAGKGAPQAKPEVDGLWMPEWKRRVLLAVWMRCNTDHCFLLHSQSSSLASSSSFQLTKPLSECVVSLARPSKHLDLSRAAESRTLAASH